MRVASLGTALAVCAALAAGSRPCFAQRASDTPYLSVPSGAPPAAPAPTINLDSAISAALKAAGMAAPEAQPPAPEPQRGNPFASPVRAPAANQRMLIPLNPGAENVHVQDDQDGLISLMVREGSLRQVIAMIAETQKLNIVFAGPNDTLVTASFDRQPWQTVLDSLLAASGHIWTTRGEVIFVSSAEMADFLGASADGRTVQLFELDFVSAIDVDQAIKGLLSPAGKSWVTESSSEDTRRTKEAIAVVDFPANLARISDYVCQADQPPRQVFIQAHILQIELSDDCRNGINFENIIRMSSTPLKLKNVGFANASAATAFMVDVEGDGTNGLDGLIELLQNTTDAKTLASPKINAVSGQFSRIQIGDQLPYRNTATTQTASLQSAQFLDVGIVLEVTPRVTRDGRVLMKIKPEVSTGEYRPEAEGLPSKKTTEVETDVLMASGEGMVIGGLIQEVDSNIQSKLPWLGDIPYLGVLFQKRQVVKSRKEIIVTLRPFVLPYSPVLYEEHQAQIVRAEDPLTQGAICRYPRPYEPRLPDTFDNHKHKFKMGAWLPGEEYAAAPEELGLMELPPVEAPHGELPEELPPPNAWAPEAEGAYPELLDPEPPLQ